MSDSPDDIPDIPDFATLAADPEIAPLLGFDPVTRKVRRPDGWTDDLQRELIARLAATGTLQQAVWQMGKHATGAEALYKVPSADSFRAAWDQAVAIGRRRQGLDSAPPHAGPVPGIERRSRRGFGPEPEPEDMDDETKAEMVEHLARKFMRKVAQEREARLAGEVVAADFYLRQVTSLEVAFDLITEEHGLDGWQALTSLRRGGHSWLEIAETPLSRALDDMRRNYWREHQLPDRPEHPPQRHCIDHGGVRLEPLEVTTGGGPLSHDEQRAAFEAQHAREAEEQILWEAASRAQAEEWRAANPAVPPRNGEGDQP